MSSSVIVKEGVVALPDNMVGNSLPMWKLRTYMEKVAATASNVLITGETGSGKEIAARYIHRFSARHNNPFIAINCAALPDGLLESELFGYERGAFTGAMTAYAGRLRLADGGTVLFDEIGDMSSYAQAKILRVIESREVYPLGGRRTVPINTRFIAATNRDLEGQVKRGDFREDLYYRLNVARISLPPLRDRREDIAPLLAHYCEHFESRVGNRLLGFTTEAMAVLQSYGWPGNVRELINLIERIFIDPPNGLVDVSDLPSSIRVANTARAKQAPEERDVLLYTLSRNNWNKSKAAEQLRWSRMTLYRKIAKYHLVERREETLPDPMESKPLCNKFSTVATKL
jgi:DNA-binding NtrC family response regulator